MVGIKSINSHKRSYLYDPPGNRAGFLFMRESLVTPAHPCAGLVVRFHGYGPFDSALPLPFVLVVVYA